MDGLLPSFPEKMGLSDKAVLQILSLFGFTAYSDIFSTCYYATEIYENNNCPRLYNWPTSF